jgi:hypothetical protein
MAYLHRCVSILLVLIAVPFAASWGTLELATNPFDGSDVTGVSVQTSHLYAVQKNFNAQSDDYQFGFTVLVDRINGRSNQVAAGILDGAPGGSPMTRIEILEDSEQRIAYRVFYQDGRRWVYSYYPSSPVIRVDYESWNFFKAFQDFCTPGGDRDDNQPVIHGSDSWVRDIIDMTEGTYYERSRDGSSGGSLNYQGWMIFGINNPENDNGYARVYQFEKLNKVKLMYDLGIEAFFTGGPVTGYIFPFSDGPSKMLSLAYQVVARHAGGLGMADMGASTETLSAHRPGRFSPARIAPLASVPLRLVNLAGRVVRLHAGNRPPETRIYPANGARVVYITR